MEDHCERPMAGREPINFGRAVRLFMRGETIVGTTYLWPCKAEPVTVWHEDQSGQDLVEIDAAAYAKFGLRGATG